MSKNKIYAYIEPGVTYLEGFIKIGQTEREVVERIDEQTRTAGVKYKILLVEPAVKDDGSEFRDTDVHKILKDQGFENLRLDNKSEWFKCSLAEVQAAISAVKTGNAYAKARTQNFAMRPEQAEAVRVTSEYFLNNQDDARALRFLWNAKMRFGKTFAAYKLCQKMNFSKILILTFKPAVESAWRSDAENHVDFSGWQFISNKTAEAKGINIAEDFERSSKDQPVAVFGSFQDLLGKSNNKIKAKNKFIHEVNWDIVIFDEYHYGAWRDNAKSLFKDFDEESAANFESVKDDEADDVIDENIFSDLIKAKYYLYLSGTPFRALSSGEFMEDQIYNWTYSDEQQAKLKWRGDNNPYESLPQMQMMTYQMPDEINIIMSSGDLERDEFDLNAFFSLDENKKFKFENEISKWLKLIHEELVFKDVNFRNYLKHTLWFMPDVASCFAMGELLRRDKFFDDYKIIVCAGDKVGNGIDALNYLRGRVRNPESEKSVTLSCGKLTTGVTVEFWTGVFMLRNLKGPETYFQTAFRVQSPWTVRDDDYNLKILKDKCYIFDFALNRALRQIAEYSYGLSVSHETSPESKINEFIKFLPVLAYDGSKMTQINAEEIWELASSDVSATMLARKWRSPELINVDNLALERLLDDKETLNAVMKIESFRALNKDIEAVINKSEHVRKLKSRDNLTKKQKKELSDEEKEIRKTRQEIREKLMKFVQRVPVFMYLTDYREKTLYEVITQLDTELFNKVTGLTLEDFKRLCELNLFNEAKINAAIYAFRKCEESSLNYTGLNMHEGERLGGFNEIKPAQNFEFRLEPDRELEFEFASFTELKPKSERKPEPEQFSQSLKQEPKPNIFKRIMNKIIKF